MRIYKILRTKFPPEIARIIIAYLIEEQQRSAHKRLMNEILIHSLIQQNRPVIMEYRFTNGWVTINLNQSNLIPHLVSAHTLHQK
jgi:hypothetical protein